MFLALYVSMHRLYPLGDILLFQVFSVPLKLLDQLVPYILWKLFMTGVKC